MESASSYSAGVNEKILTLELRVRELEKEVANKNRAIALRDVKIERLENIVGAGYQSPAVLTSSFD